MCYAAARRTKGLVYWERIYMDDETLGDRMFIRKKDKKYRGGGEADGPVSSYWNSCIPAYLWSNFA